MFYYVDGTVSVLRQGLAVIDCGGVGYACHASQNTISRLKIGTKARLLTYLNVREGFSSCTVLSTRRKSPASR